MAKREMNRGALESTAPPMAVGVLHSEVYSGNVRYGVASYELVVLWSESKVLYNPHGYGILRFDAA